MQGASVHPDFNGVSSLAGPNMTHPTLVNERMRAFIEGENDREDGPKTNPLLDVFVSPSP